MSDGTCSVDGCEGGSRLTLGLCPKHYARLLRRGSTDDPAPRVRQVLEVCLVEDCGDIAVNSRGYCSNHYRRLRTYGSPLGRHEAPAPDPDLPGETWRPVAGWEGLYEVSDYPRVRSLPRDTRSGVRGGRILKQCFDGKGYLFVGLSRESAVEQCRVHQMVAAAFIGPCPDGMEVCHGPLGKHCNKPGNLRYDTRRNNILDSVREGTQASVRKKVCGICGSDYRRKANGSGRYCPKQHSHSSYPLFKSRARLRPNTI